MPSAKLPISIDPFESQTEHDAGNSGLP
jgi:hypothetical protein